MLQQIAVLPSALAFKQGNCLKIEFLVVEDFLEHQLKNLANVALVPTLVRITHTVYYAGDTSMRENAGPTKR